MNNTVAMYPFNAKMLPIVKYFHDLQSKYHLAKIISPPGFSLTGHDAAYSRNHPDVGFIVNDTIDEHDPDWRTLIIECAMNDATETNDFIETNYDEIITRCLQAGKSVVQYNSDTKSSNRKLNQVHDKYPGMLHVKIPSLPEYPLKNVSSEKINSITTPVVFVGGLLAEADTTEVVLALLKRLQKDNLSVMTISCHHILDIFGAYNIGGILFNKEITEPKKILTLNSLIRNLEHHTRPDVILIEAPDAVIRYSNNAPNGMGIYSYMLCQAVQPDYFICCVPYQFATNKMIEKINDDLRVRLGASMFAIHVSNVQVDYDRINTMNKISCVHNDRKSVLSMLSGYTANSSIPMFDIVHDGIDSLYRLLTKDII